MKSLKKLVFVLVMTLLLLVVFGCDISFGGTNVKVGENGGNEPGENEPAQTIDLQTVFNAIVSELGDRTSVVSDLVLPAAKDGVSIVWTSDKPEVISNDGKVNRPLDDERVILSCILKYGDVTKQFNISVTVKGNRSELPDGYDKIGEVIAKEAGTSATVKGVVVGVTAQSFLVKDDSGYILVYQGKNFAGDLVAGDLVIVSGATAEYAGMKQFGTDATYEKQEEKGTDSGTFEELDAAKFDSLTTNVTVKLVKVIGKLIKSGNYWNLEVDGANTKGSVSYPSQNLDEFDGKYVELTGYFVGVTGSSTKYITFVLTAIKEAEGYVAPTPTPVEATEGTLAEIAALEVGKDYKATAVVVATAKQGLLLKDNSGLMYVYMGADLDASITVGSKVEVVGKTSLYGGFVQFDRPTLTVKGTEEVTQPEPTTLDKESYEALLNATSIAYYKLNAKLTISNNKYFNLTFEGSEVAGSLVAPAIDVTSIAGNNVEIEGYFVYVSGSTTKYLYFIATKIGDLGTSTPTPTPVETATISAVKAGEVGAEYKAEGTVIAMAKQGLLVKDDTDMIYVYMGADIDSEIVVGSVVTIEGATSEYGGFVQFNKPTLTKTGSEEVTQPEPIALDKASFEGLLEATSLGYYKFTAKLSISSGRYFNLAFEGSEAVGSLVAPREDVKALDGKDVDVVGYFAYVTGSTIKYIYFVATSVEETILTDAEYVALAEQEMAKFNGNTYRSDLTLPLENNKCTISWASSNTEVIANDGKFTMPASDTEVTLTATITKGEITKTVTVTVTAKYVDPTTVASVKYNFGESEEFLAWGQSYAAHELNYEEIKVSFVSANKQREGNAIDDMPVTKGGDVIVFAKTGTFASVTWTFKQWGTKTQTATISVSTDGGLTFTETASTVAVEGEATTLEIACGEGVNAVKVTFSSTSNQVGIAGVEFTTK